MPYTLASILAPRTAAQLRDAMLATLGAAGFPVTSWREGGTARTLVELAAEGTAQAWALAAAVARGALLVYAEGDWLTELARSHFDVARSPATFTRGYVRLTAAPGAGPYNIPAGALVVSDGARYYRGTNASTVVGPAGSYVDVPVRAEGAGSAYNRPALDVLVSPALPGVAVTSPAYGAGSSWRTADGRDEETDVDLRARCVARWATLGRGATEAAYRYLATSCPDAPGVTRAAVVPGPGDGTLTLYLATSSGPASPTEASLVAAWLAPLKPLTDVAAVAPAAAAPVSIVGTVRTRDTSAANLARITDALTALQTSLGIGDDVDLGAVYAACYAARDVVDVDLSSPAADTAVSPHAVATLAWSIALESP